MASVPLPGVTPPPPGGAIRVVVEGVPVAVFNLSGELRAIEARCPHRGGPLERGPVAGHTVTCPLHGSQFDIDTGQVKRGPAMLGVKTYAVRVDGATLVVDVP